MRAYPSKPPTVANTATGAYRGPHPFYLWCKGAGISGPFSFAQIREHLARHPERARDLEISSDGSSFISLFRFAVMMGLESWVSGLQPSFDDDAADGSLRTQSLISVLTLLQRRRATGRLILTDGEHGRREIHLVGGRPTYVFSDAKRHQLPDRLVERGRIAAAQIPATIHLALERGQTIDVVADRRGTGEWAALMKERLAEIFTWTMGSFRFDARIAPVGRAPFAPSLVSLFVDMVSRSRKEEALLERLTRRRALDRSYVKSERFGAEVDELALGPVASTAARALLSGRTIRSVLGRTDADSRRAVLVAAHVLLEQGLLVDPRLVDPRVAAAA